MSQLRTSSIQHPSSSSANIVLAADGSVEIGSMNGFRYAGTRYYTSSGQFEKADPLGTGDIGLRAIRVRVQGAGGGGGGAAVTGAGQVSMGGGGSGGEYREIFITDIAGLASSVTVTRGAAGAGGSGVAGTAGGQSEFGALEAGGGGGGGSVAAGAAPRQSATSGVPSTGAGVADLTIAGSRGSQGFSYDAGLVTSGAAGNSLFGPGGPSVTFASFSNGVPGGGFGAGGGGALNGVNQGTARVGAAGRDGIVIIDCFV